MSKQIREMTPEELDTLPILGLDDSFEFTCKGCGKCCKQREDLLLTPYDLFRIAVYFNRTPKEIFERYCEVYEGPTSHIPVIRLKPVPPDNSCPFLHNRKCAIHERKPGICRVYPLARIFKGDAESQYYFNGASCNHDPKKVTVREWIKDFASEESEKVGQLWRDIVIFISPKLQPNAKELSDEKRQKLLSIIFCYFWLFYDIKEPFIVQLEQNYHELEKILETENII